MANADGSTSEFLQTEDYYCYIWKGTADELIGAGIVERTDLPGEPGNNKVSATYFEGKLVRAGQSFPRDDRYLNIVRRGKKFKVTRGKPDAEIANCLATTKTKTKTAEIHVDSKNSSRKEPTFRIGEIVQVNAYKAVGSAKVTGMKWYEDQNGEHGDGWSYAVDPNPSQWRGWFHERCVAPYNHSAIPIWTAAMKRKNGVLKPTTKPNKVDPEIRTPI